MHFVFISTTSNYRQKRKETAYKFSSNTRQIYIQSVEETLLKLAKLRISSDNQPQVATANYNK